MFPAVFTAVSVVQAAARKQRLVVNVAIFFIETIECFAIANRLAELLRRSIDSLDQQERLQATRYLVRVADRSDRLIDGIVDVKYNDRIGRPAEYQEAQDVLDGFAKRVPSGAMTIAAGNQRFSAAGCLRTSLSEESVDHAQHQGRLDVSPLEVQQVLDVATRLVETLLRENVRVSLKLRLVVDFQDAALASQLETLRSKVSA